MTPNIHRFDREEFLARRFHYQAGEHVTLIAPTQWGKTTLAQQLLAQVSTPKLPAVVLVMKPRDKVVRAWAKSDGLRVVRNWPPPVWSTQVERPPGYILWPRHTFVPARDNAHLRAEFQRAIQDSYKRGNRLIFCDEVTGLVDVLGLNLDVQTLWTQGSSMGCGLWAASQRPARVPLWAYSQASHLFLGRIGDRRDRKRFGEISGIDARAVEDWTLGLNKYEWLYIAPNGNGGNPACCIVSA